MVVACAVATVVVATGAGVGACTGTFTGSWFAPAVKVTAGATGLFLSIRILLPFFVSISSTPRSFLLARSISLFTSSRSYFLRRKTSIINPPYIS